ncbi:MAG TPA: hypothetical protein VI365_05390 [Trebonia sp.]
MVATGLTNAKGTVVLVGPRMAANANFVIKGTDKLASVASAPVAVTVVPHVAVRVGAAHVLTVTVWPAAAGDPADLQVLQDGTWRLVADLELTAHKATYKATPGATYRVTIPATATHEAAVSASVTVPESGAAATSAPATATPTATRSARAGAAASRSASPDPTPSVTPAEYALLPQLAPPPVAVSRKPPVAVSGGVESRARCRCWWPVRRPLPATGAGSHPTIADNGCGMARPTPGNGWKCAVGWRGAAPGATLWCRDC